MNLYGTQFFGCSWAVLGLFGLRNKVVLFLWSPHPPPGFSSPCFLIESNPSKVSFRRKWKILTTGGSYVTDITRDDWGSRYHAFPRTLLTVMMQNEMTNILSHFQSPWYMQVRSLPEKLVDVTSPSCPSSSFLSPKWWSWLYVVAMPNHLLPFVIALIWNLEHNTYPIFQVECHIFPENI